MMREKRRLSREEWLHRALEVVGAGGHGKLRIHRLVKDLGVTRGSFYWHFKNREEFVRSLAERWVAWSTGQVIDNVAEAGPDPRVRLLALMKLVITEDLAKYDLAIQSWAFQEPSVAEVVRQTLARRIDFVRGLFSEMGFEGDDLGVRVISFVGFMQLQGLYPVESKREQLRLVEGRHRYFTRP